MHSDREQATALMQDNHMVSSTLSPMRGGGCYKVISLIQYLIKFQWGLHAGDGQVNFSD